MGFSLSTIPSTCTNTEPQLGHGVAFSPDKRTLYASSLAEVYAWDYDPNTVTVSNKRTLISGMLNGGHPTRTLMLSAKQPNILLVTQGSETNVDEKARDINSGISQIRAFDIGALQPGQVYDYPTEGTLIGWGLRNSNGVDEDPITGGIFSVENSADEIHRQGVDIHNDNPGEELNFHGYLNGTSNEGGHHGYPECLALWSTGPEVPSLGNMTVGDQFSWDESLPGIDDAACNSNTYIKPRLTFQVRLQFFPVFLSRYSCLNPVIHFIYLSSPRPPT